MCTAPLNTPEQINLQLATRDVVVAAFVTYHGQDDAPTPLDVPVAMVGTSSDESAMISISGIFHAYREPLAPSTKETGRNYTMSFVRFGGLEPRTQYVTAALFVILPPPSPLYLRHPPSRGRST